MNRLIERKPGLLVALLTLGVFGIINTEMGVVGIIPQIAETFGVTVPQAGWTVSVFALIVAISAPIMPLLFSGINRRTVMLLALGLFTVSNLISIFTESFAVLLVARVLPAFLHPVYVSMAFTVAAQSVGKEDAPKAVSRVFIGVSAGMVLGVPVTSFIASHTSFAVAMSFFAAINTLVLLATLFYVPSMPVRERLSYGTQLCVLKKTIVWYSVLAFTLINGAMFGFFSFMSDYLNCVTGFAFDTVSVLLLVYGIANIIGNILAGKMFLRHKQRYMIVMPVIMFAGYLLLFLFGKQSSIAGVLVLLTGLLAGFVNIVGQYMISSSATEAPDFANGLFLTAANFGTMAGTVLCGAFITAAGTRYSLMGTLLFLVLSLLFVGLRYRTTHKLNKKLKTIEL
ncbi:MAG: MFS transporter [Phocaeicola dorei]|nr:MFS transporter [Phocaeicola dorei]